jgi:hypothetical protein
MVGWESEAWKQGAAREGKERNWKWIEDKLDGLDAIIDRCKK